MVIDPGHGGSSTVGGSSPNNATSFSGVLEKTMCLEMGRLVRDALTALAPEEGVDLELHLTRTGDYNLGLSSRANKARNERADVFASIHFNAFNATARGVETHVRPSGSGGNVNLSADRGLAKRINDGIYGALRKHDSAAVNRGLKETRLGVLNDSYLGNTSGNAKTRACLIEIEFIDVRLVDRLLNIAPNPNLVKRDIANAIARAILADIKAHS